MNCKVGGRIYAIARKAVFILKASTFRFLYGIFLLRLS
jgi:hypothetical protein